MIYNELIYNEEIEPGDFVIFSKDNALYYGFYKGLGNGTIQILTVPSIIYAHKKNLKARVDYVYGQAKNWKVIKSHPDFITRDRDNLDRALEIIRETKVVPVKY
jgi:hypothetical protein